MRLVSRLLFAITTTVLLAFGIGIMVAIFVLITSNMSLQDVINQVFAFEDVASSLSRIVLLIGIVAIPALVALWPVIYRLVRNILARNGDEDELEVNLENTVSYNSEHSFTAPTRENTAEHILELEETKRAMINLLEDIDAEKAVSEQAKARDEAIIASIGEGLVVADLDRRILLVNRAVEQMSGFSEKELIGKIWPEIMRPNDGDGNLIPADKLVMRRTIKEGVTVTSSYFYTRKDNTIFPIAITASPVVINGKTMGGVVVFRDITREKEIDRGKSEFVSLAAHQLRAPATIINWYVELLVDEEAGKLNAKQKDYLATIYRASRELSELVSALLNISRIELGTFVFQPRMTDIQALYSSVVEDFKRIIDEKELHLEDPAKNIGTIFIDHDLIRIVLQNFISNAVKYTPAGGSIHTTISIVKVGGSLSGRGIQHDSFVMSVKDTGMGIPENEKSSIFTKFFRASNVKKEDEEGSGLGLYIVKSFVEHAGGSVYFESEQDKGTTFYAIVPLPNIPATTK